eukprot:CAMPEP_0167820232 /NCGR_PEP_ID=MMETSP0112_2-20121227/5955_1 /TAXON_ID=91324 /ORGANISM="Lotharella globosa, Strain CCCM811" /LENGTH=168 /DNA_ID=CAMNT_0007720723 /DNA_START=145 /DNA_END=651 /DNA_ORIENTATION=+
MIAVVALVLFASSSFSLSTSRSGIETPAPNTQQEQDVEEFDLEDLPFGFANVCELEVAQFYCHLNPKDAFCGTKLRTCIEIKAQCQGFNVDECTEDQPCCQCAFQDCPLESEGCELLANKCGIQDDASFQSHLEIAKASGMVKPGKIPIKINDPGLGSRIGGFPILHS